MEGSGAWKGPLACQESTWKPAVTAQGNPPGREGAAGSHDAVGAWGPEHLRRPLPAQVLILALGMPTGFSPAALRRL